MFITRMADTITDSLVGVLNHFSHGFEAKSREARKRTLRIFLIVEVITILLAFLLASRKLRLVLDVFYCTTPGAVMNIFENLINFGKLSMEEQHEIGIMRAVFIGNSVTWIASGIQGILTAWYEGLTESLNGKSLAGKILHLLNLILFNFFTGVIISAIMSVIVIRNKNGLLLTLVILPMLILALSNFITNIKNMIAMIPATLFVAWLWGVVFRALTGAKAAEHVFETEAAAEAYYLSDAAVIIYTLIVILAYGLVVWIRKSRAEKRQQNQQKRTPRK